MALRIVDVAVAVAVRAHVARRGEAGPQVGLQVLDGDERRALAWSCFGRRVLNMCVCASMRPGSTVAWPRSMTCTPAGIRDLTLRADVGDALAVHEHDLLRQHLAAVAVEQAAGADGDRARGRRTLQDAALGPHARLRAGEPPRALRRLARRRRWRLREYRARQERRLLQRLTQRGILPAKTVARVIRLHNLRSVCRRRRPPWRRASASPCAWCCRCPRTRTRLRAARARRRRRARRRAACPGP